MIAALLLFVLPTVFALGVLIGWTIRDRSAELERRRWPRALPKDRTAA